VLPHDGFLPDPGRVPDRGDSVRAGAGPELAYVALAYALSWAQGWPTVVDLSTYSGAAVMPWFALVPVVLVVNGFGEEIGWRGFLVDRLAPRMGLVRTSLLVAAVWATWHLPLFWVSESFASFGLPGTLGWVTSLTAGSVVLAWMYLASGRSIWLVALWHTAFNLVTATTAGGGRAAPVVSAAVIAAAVVIVTRTPANRRRRRTTSSESRGDQTDTRVPSTSVATCSAHPHDTVTPAPPWP